MVCEPWFTFSGPGHYQFLGEEDKYQGPGGGFNLEIMFWDPAGALSKSEGECIQTGHG